MNPRCTGCSITCCSERFSETDKETGSAWAKVYHKMLASRSLRRYIRDDGHGDIGWLLVALILEAKRIEHSHGVLCDHGHKLGVSDFVDACALAPDVVATNMERLIEAETVIEIDGAYILSGFDRLQYSRTTLWRRSNPVSVNVSVKHAVKQDAEAEAEAEAENKNPPTPLPGGALDLQVEKADRPKATKPERHPLCRDIAPKHEDALRRLCEQRGRTMDQGVAAVLKVINHHEAARKRALALAVPPPFTTIPARRQGQKSEVMLIIDRFHDGYTAEQLCDAADGICADEWHLQAKKLEWEYLYRNAANVDRFIASKSQEAAEKAAIAAKAERSYQRAREVSAKMREGYDPVSHEQVTAILKANGFRRLPSAEDAAAMDDAEEGEHDAA